MYVPYREDNQVNIKFRIPWDKQTARGFGIALGITILLLLLISITKYTNTNNNLDSQNLVPVEMINFGPGDGTGASKGNLSKEGAAHKGARTLSDLEDASVAAQYSKSPKSPASDPENYSSLTAVADASSGEKSSKNPLDGDAGKNVGALTGQPDGTGTGKTGFGPGAGEGLGDIEWGGGGNRTVLFKKLPKYPAGNNTQAQIRIRFTVSAEGQVTTMYPLQKADPALERAAMEALRLWKFNRLRDNREMFGIITFTFRLS
jgi:TonB family protein